ARLCLYERAAEAGDARVGLSLDGVARLGLRVAVAFALRLRARGVELGLALGELEGISGDAPLLRLGNDLGLTGNLLAGRLGDAGVAARLCLYERAAEAGDARVGLSLDGVARLGLRVAVASALRLGARGVELGLA